MTLRAVFFKREPEALNSAQKRVLDKYIVGLMKQLREQLSEMSIRKMLAGILGGIVTRADLEDYDLLELDYIRDLVHILEDYPHLTSLGKLNDKTAPPVTKHAVFNHLRRGLNHELRAIESSLAKSKEGDMGGETPQRSLIDENLILSRGERILAPFKEQKGDITKGSRTALYVEGLNKDGYHFIDYYDMKADSKGRISVVCEGLNLPFTKFDQSAKSKVKTYVVKAEKWTELYESIRSEVDKEEKNIREGKASSSMGKPDTYYGYVGIWASNHLKAIGVDVKVEDFVKPREWTFWPFF